MAQLFTYPLAQVDANGNPYSGALLYFYTTGTTTPITIYSDFGLTTPVTNPVTADSAGHFARIYVADGIYKIVHKTAAAVTLETVDPVGTDVTGPSSSTDNGIARWDGTSGKRLQNSGVTIDDSNNLTTPAGTTLTIGDAGTLSIGAGVGTFTNSAGPRLNIGGTAIAIIPNTDGLDFGQPSPARRWTVYADTATTDNLRVASAGDSRFAQSSTSTPAIDNVVGAAITSGGIGHFSAANASLQVNVTSDGTLTTWRSGGTAQGSVTVSGATVTYGAFTGVHWTQLRGGAAKIELLRGTIVETVDEMCVWKALRYTDETGAVRINEEDCDQALPIGIVTDYTYVHDEETITVKATVIQLFNSTLVRFRVAQPHSSRPYGVVAFWDHDGSNDLNVASLGTYPVRIAKGEVVEGGDWIETGDVKGCGRRMDPDMPLTVGSARRHVATVAANIPVPAYEGASLYYPDGSYLVPCTIHCG